MTNPLIPKDNYISRIADRLKKEENEKKYNEFAYIFYKSIKESVNRNIPLNLTNMLKIENEAIKKMFKLK
jgi:hypothetical protein